tara:strand:+ start:177 stop:485 length:309 start_codon:yes stop_codon:yes gene_type:complete
MYKNFLFLIIFVFFTNCSTPGTAFLGPIFTGAKTGSLYQASLSYGSNKLVHNLKNIKDSESFRKISSFIEDQKNVINEPIILTNFSVAKIEISEVIEPEPLP